MKAELAMMKEKKICMEARLIAAENSLEEHKRVLSEYKAIEKLVDDLVDVVIEAGGDNLDKEIMKVLIEEAMSFFTES